MSRMLTGILPCVRVPGRLLCCPAITPGTAWSHGHSVRTVGMPWSVCQGLPEGDEWPTELNCGHLRSDDAGTGQTGEGGTSWRNIRSGSAAGEKQSVSGACKAAHQTQGGKTPTRSTGSQHHRCAALKAHLSLCSLDLCFLPWQSQAPGFPGTQGREHALALSNLTSGREGGPVASLF